MSSLIYCELMGNCENVVVDSKAVLKNSIFISNIGTMEQTSFYSEEELLEIGFKYVGNCVKISRKTSIYGASGITVGDNVRIDDFCILSGRITLGSYIHIAAYCGLFGGGTGIEMRDFSALSSRSVIYAESDDYGGEYLTNPTIPEKYLHIIKGKVTFHKHVIIGSGCTILPGVTIGEGASVGSMSLINKSLDAWCIYVGIPCRKLSDRKRDLLKLESQLKGIN